MKFTFNDEDYEFEVVDETYFNEDALVYDSDLEEYVDVNASNFEFLNVVHGLYCVTYEEKSTGLKYHAQLGIDVFPKEQDWEFNNRDILEQFDYDDYSPNFDDDDLEEEFEDAVIEAVGEDIKKHFQNKIENDEIPEFCEQMDLELKLFMEEESFELPDHLMNKVEIESELDLVMFALNYENHPEIVGKPIDFEQDNQLVKIKDEHFIKNKEGVFTGIDEQLVDDIKATCDKKLYETPEQKPETPKARRKNRM